MAEDATRMDLSFGDSDDDDDDYEIEAKSSHHQKIDESFSTDKILNDHKRRLETLETIVEGSIEVTSSIDKQSFRKMII